MAGKLQSLTIESRLPPNLSKDIYVPSLIESRLNSSVTVTIPVRAAPIVCPFPLALGGGGLDGEKGGENCEEKGCLFFHNSRFKGGKWFVVFNYNSGNKDIKFCDIRYYWLLVSVEPPQCGGSTAADILTHLAPRKSPTSRQGRKLGRTMRHTTHRNVPQGRHIVCYPCGTRT